MDKPFQEAKQLLVKACQLTLPDPAAPLAITTDASKYAVGAVLEQFSDGAWRPLGFWSRHLKPDKMCWTTFRRELYAIQQGIRHFIDKIQGRHLIVFTDHKAILGAFQSPTSQAHDVIATNHLQEIGQWTSDVRFLAGKSNAVADLLSRPTDVPLGTAYTMSDPDQLASL